MAKEPGSTNILLESGTNELELMEFTIAGNVFGINVAKLNKIIKYEPVKPMPNSHPHVKGIFKPRDKIITVIDLPAYMNLPEMEDTERNYFIITNFNKIEVAFLVHTVVGICRISWDNIEKPDNTIYGGVEGLATGIAKVKDRLITIVDFEKIIYDIAPETGIQIEEIKALGPRERSEKPLLIAEDSQLLQRLILDAIHEAGYTNITSFNNGQEAWDYLTSVRRAVIEEGRQLENLAGALITDIEMPKMDGHRLTKLVKEDSTLKRIPVIIFSSLIDEAMRVKGESLGANAQLSKPEIGNLVNTLDEWIL